MNKKIQMIQEYITTRVSRLVAIFKRQSRPIKIGIVALAILLVAISLHFLKNEKVDQEVVAAPREVTLKSLTELSGNDSSLPLLGVVTSVSEATIRSEASGKLTYVYRKLGDYVTAGQIIAQFENSSERAGVLQAEGVYEAAKAGRDIARINSGTTNTSLSDVQTGVLNTIASAYVTMDDSIRVKTDAAYSNPRSADIKFLLSVPDARLVLSLEAKRKVIEKMLQAREEKNKTLTTSSDLLTELQTVQNEAQTVKIYMDDLSQAYAKAIPDSSFTQQVLDAGKAQVGGARSAISGLNAALVASKTALTNSLAAQEIQGKTSGTSDEGQTTADAAVKQALGAYQGALSRLSKTIIRSPINGTLNSLSINTGDFISAFTEIGVVSNNGALEVVTNVTEDDAKRVIVGSPVTLDGGVAGIVTRVAPALDPLTKKIEVRIGIKDVKAALINGQSVRIEVASPVQKTPSKTKVPGPQNITLSAVKITPKGNLVFTTDASSTLVALPVITGALSGDQIQVISGIPNGTRIVTDARGLKEGMSVTIRTETE